MLMGVLIVLWMWFSVSAAVSFVSSSESRELKIVQSELSNKMCSVVARDSSESFTSSTPECLAW